MEGIEGGDPSSSFLVFASGVRPELSSSTRFASEVVLEEQFTIDVHWMDGQIRLDGWSDQTGWMVRSD